LRTGTRFGVALAARCERGNDVVADTEMAWRRTADGLLLNPGQVAGRVRSWAGARTLLGNWAAAREKERKKEEKRGKGGVGWIEAFGPKQFQE
jgi:hypothetical protein